MEIVSYDGAWYTTMVLHTGTLQYLRYQWSETKFSSTMITFDRLYIQLTPETEGNNVEVGGGGGGLQALEVYFAHSIFYPVVKYGLDADNSNMQVPGTARCM